MCVCVFTTLFVHVCVQVCVLLKKSLKVGNEFSISKRYALRLTQRLPFSVAATPRYNGGRYSFPWIVPLYS